MLRAAEVVRSAIGEASGADESGTEHAAATSGIEEVVQLLLAERAALEPGAPGSVPPQHTLPDRITASTFHEFVEDPISAERRRIRPVPQRPYRRTRTGNRFHEWVERRATTAKGSALPLSGFDFEEWNAATTAGETEAGVGSGAGIEFEADLQPLIDQFERSRWANLRPIAVEQEVTLPFAGRSLVCKLDAVYRTDDANGARFEVVDWKSGRSPRTADERQSRFFQLDLYRHAYAQWAGVEPEQIDVSLFYVAEGVELVGESPRSLAELERVWLDAAERSVPEGVSSGSTGSSSSEIGSVS